MFHLFHQEVLMNLIKLGLLAAICKDVNWDIKRKSYAIVKEVLLFYPLPEVMTSQLNSVQWM